ncbi:hypothetical protein GE09DRAFT_29539 [Coniochaeta sp. 2T2.1]|nr:hypothetical protein GE09DRAFT_29539 [Coniochaeta sp. 2T2.1]
MRLPSWLTWYKKPEYRDIKEYATEVRSGKRQLSPDGRGKTAIPSRLKLERILQNKTCSPMSLYDFYMYLKYIEFSAENLEFYIWFKNYETAYLKMGSDKDDNSVHSSPESTSSEVHLAEKLPNIDVSDFSVDQEVAKDTIDRITRMISSEALCTSGKCSPSVGQRVRSFIRPDATTAALPVPPPQPARFPGTSSTHHDVSPLPASGPRSELNAIIETFLLPGSEMELNIPPLLRDTALLGLRSSSSSSSSPSPAHLRPVADHVYSLLRNCSHRNFVRLGVSNGTFETVCVATGLGIVLTLAGFLTVLLHACVPHVGAHARWNAFVSWPMWWLGVSLILSGLRGSCFFLLLFSRRQPLPWERFDDDGGSSVLSQRSGIVKVLSRLMIFDRKFKVQDEHLRRLQRKIVLQSLIGGAVFANLAVLLFVFLPVWRETVRA